MGISPGTRNLKEVITYWPTTGVRDDFNELGFGAPVLLHGRWVEAQEEVVNPLGEVIVSRTQVVLDTGVAIHGYLAQGTHTSESNPHNIVGSCEIQAYKEYPDLRSMTQQKKAFL